MLVQFGENWIQNKKIPQNARLNSAFIINGLRPVFNFGHPLRIFFTSAIISKLDSM